MPGDHLGPAVALAEAAAAMHAQPDLAGTARAAVRTATDVLAAEAVALLGRDRHGWRVDARHGPGPLPPHLPALTGAPSAGWWASGWFRVDDLAVDAPRPQWQRELRPLGWRSVLVVSADGEADPPSSLLVWCSRRAGEFAGRVKLARLFGTHAATALAAARARDSLAQAVAARHRTGQAQGIVMARHGLTPDQAFDALRRRSQRENVKVRTVADEVIWTGDLDAAYLYPEGPAAAPA